MIATKLLTTFILINLIISSVLSKPKPNPKPLCGCNKNKSKSKRSLITETEDMNGLFEGDMKLNNRQKLEVLGYRNIVQYKDELWSAGVVYYKTSKKVNGALIKKYLSELSDHTRGCIKFVKATRKDKDYVRVINGTGCWSSVGRLGGKQFLSLGRGCASERSIKHEFIHALGFAHEQSRPDRDDHIKIHYNNIDSRSCINFATWGALPNLPYDHKSIMHYGSHYFGCPRDRLTITTHDGKRVGGATTTSSLDIAKIRDLYGCK